MMATSETVPDAVIYDGPPRSTSWECRLRQLSVTGYIVDRHWKICPGSKHWCGFQRVVTGSFAPPVTTRDWRRRLLLRRP